MRLYRRYIAWVYDRRREAPFRRERNGNKAVLHTCEFDAVNLAHIDEAELDGGDDRDPARAPLGLVTGVALGAVMWIAITAAIIAIA